MLRRLPNALLFTSASVLSFDDLHLLVQFCRRDETSLSFLRFRSPGKEGRGPTLSGEQGTIKGLVWWRREIAARSSSKRTLSSVLFVLQARSRLIVEDVLPQAPLPRDPSFHDGHSSLFSTLLALVRSRTLARSLALALSLALLTGTLGQHPRYTATRSGVAALASSPAVPARKRSSFLSSCLLPCLSLPDCLFRLPACFAYLLCLSACLTCLPACSPAYLPLLFRP